jgi:hypothetical protein
MASEYADRLEVDVAMRRSMSRIVEEAELTKLIVDNPPCADALCAGRMSAAALESLQFSSILPYWRCLGAFYMRFELSFNQQSYQVVDSSH